MKNVYAKSFEKKWYATTPLLALITTQGRCLNAAYAKSRPLHAITKGDFMKKCLVCILRGECYEIMEQSSFADVHNVVYCMSTPAGKHRSLAPLRIYKINGRPPRLLPLSPY